MRLGETDTYRFFIAGLTSTTGTLTFTYLANGWTTRAGEAKTAGSIASLDIATIASRTWLDVRLTPAGTAKVDLGPVKGDELAAIAGLTAYTDKVVQVGETTFRYLFTGDLQPGVVTVTVLAGTWTDTDGSTGAGSTSTFTLIQPAQSFFIEISGGLELRLPGLEEKLLDLRATVTLEIGDRPGGRKVFTLTFDGQLSVIQLGTVGSTSGRFVFDMGNGTDKKPGFWGVASLETNFSSLEKYGIFLYGKGVLQVNTTGEQQERDDHAQGHRSRAAPTSSATSPSRPAASPSSWLPRLRIRPRARAPTWSGSTAPSTSASRPSRASS